MKPPRRGQLKLLGERTADIAWMREQIAERKVANITDHHLSIFYELTDFDKRMALEAVVSVAGGKTYQPLREFLNP